jgi:hypothetical protein
VEQIEYARTDVGGHAVVVPTQRTVTVSRRDGGSSVARTSYSNLTPGAPAATPAPKLARLEAGVEFEIKLDDRIDFDGLAVGAPLTAHLRSAVHTPTVEAPKNAVLHCRLARLEEHQVPGHFFVVGVELLTLETDHGPVALSARLVGPQLGYDRRPDAMMRHADDPDMRPTWDARGLEIDTTNPGETAGAFRVRTPKLNVARGLAMIWQSR